MLANEVVSGDASAVSHVMPQLELGLAVLAKCCKLGERGDEMGGRK